MWSTGQHLACFTKVENNALVRHCYPKPFGLACSRTEHSSFLIKLDYLEAFCNRSHSIRLQIPIILVWLAGWLSGLCVQWKGWRGTRGYRIPSYTGKINPYCNSNARKTIMPEKQIQKMHACWPGTLSKLALEA